MNRRARLPLTPWAWALILAAATALAGAGPAEAQLKKIDAATAKEMLSSPHAGEEGWWVASNADYRAEDDSRPDYYAMRFELAPGGYASTGCMWGGRDGEVVGPFWHFQSAWDPTEEAVLMYQVNPSGMVGIGHGVLDGGQEESIQEMHVPGQPVARIRHLSSYAHPDTMVTRSFDEVDGAWEPRRQDRWVWTPADGQEPPFC